MGLFSAPTSFPKSFQPWKNKFPTVEILFSSLGNLFFHRWKVQFPLLETLGSPYETVLFLKKVHSWEGITEMVLGLFLLVL